MAYYVKLWSPTEGNAYYGIYAIICGINGTMVSKASIFLQSSSYAKSWSSVLRRTKRIGPVTYYRACG
ncbi:hypothetical protein PPTG_23757 [Phytophthora nicotianae INRA-310]|uniref:Uncharacterized protein n=1 Tax=Phytophthora nicotianae (strain INRA-310) TaxID=761204 RepID=W2PTL3_PHYN3|nr:hypothetical protein PPTG_23757 [Phytophthora nicotianae INRA-310]ETN03584.1 hypothetical protein PPTG_23757 [Phytophthora nicotianae INRA-310]